MGARDFEGQVLSGADGAARHQVDVLVIGGGPAGAWAGVSAAAQGARVLLADKGFCGTSGATAKPRSTRAPSRPLRRRSTWARCWRRAAIR
jgi:pyruvate/2-oxoglutarate dehydrogenase complex dihydrolipoamide dehydrogenase (E3) component